MFGTNRNVVLVSFKTKGSVVRFRNLLEDYRVSDPCMLFFTIMHKVTNRKQDIICPHIFFSISCFFCIFLNFLTIRWLILQNVSVSMNCTVRYQTIVSLDKFHIPLAICLSFLFCMYSPLHFFPSQNLHFSSIAVWYWIWFSNLKYNQLSGTIPESLASISTLNVLYLFFKLALISVRFEFCYLSSFVCCVLVMLKRITLAVPFPKHLVNLQTWSLCTLFFPSDQELFDILYNSIFISCMFVDFSNIRGNSISGTIPSSVVNLSNLRELYIFIETQFIWWNDD